MIVVRPIVRVVIVVVRALVVRDVPIIGVLVVWIVVRAAVGVFVVVVVPMILVILWRGGSYVGKSEHAHSDDECKKNPFHVCLHLWKLGSALIYIVSAEID